MNTKVKNYMVELKGRDISEDNPLGFQVDSTAPSNAVIKAVELMGFRHPYSCIVSGAIDNKHYSVQGLEMMRSDIEKQSRGTKRVYIANVSLLGGVRESQKMYLCSVCPKAKRK